MNFKEKIGHFADFISRHQRFYTDLWDIDKGHLIIIEIRRNYR